MNLTISPIKNYNYTNRQIAFGNEYEADKPAPVEPEQKNEELDNLRKTTNYETLGAIATAILMSLGIMAGTFDKCSDEYTKNTEARNAKELEGLRTDTLNYTDVDGDGVRDIILYLEDGTQKVIKDFTISTPAEMNTPKQKPFEK